MEKKPAKDTLSHLKDLGSDYFRKGLFEEQKPIYKYTKSQTPWGKIVDYDMKRKKIIIKGIFSIGHKEAFRAIKIGSTGSGKTWGIRSIADRTHRIGYANVILTDVKDEFKSSTKPLQKKFSDLLLGGEMARGMPVVTFRPTFFQQINKELPKNNYWYSPDFASMQRSDFMTLINVENLTRPQQDSMEIIFDAIRTHYQANKETTFSLDFFNEIIDSIAELNTLQKQALKMKFKPLYNSNFYEPKYRRNLIDLLNKGYVLSFNFKNFDAFGRKGSFKYVEVTAGIIFRELIMARRARRIKPIFIHVDEALRFMAKDINPSVKSDILQSIDLDRKEDVNLLFGVQDINSFPDTALSQCRYVFLAGNVDSGVIQDVLKAAGMVKNIQNAPNEALRWKHKLKNIKHSWLIIDRVEETVDIVVPFAPLSWHAEKGE